MNIRDRLEYLIWFPNSERLVWLNLFNPMFWILGLSTLGIVELGVVLVILGILAAVGTPAMLIAYDRGRKTTQVKRIRYLGMVLKAEATASEDKRYPATSDGNVAAKTSTEVFNYLIDIGALQSKDIVYAPVVGKVYPTPESTPDLSADNVCLNYMVSRAAGTTKGVPLDADENLPLLWSSGHEPLLVKSGAFLELKDTGVGGKSSAFAISTGIAVYYKSGEAKFMHAKSLPDGRQFVYDFVSEDYKPGKEIFRELTP